MSESQHITPETRLSTFYKAHGLKQALNRAIRAECAGGPELIESMTAMHKTAVLLHKRGAVAEYKVACAALEMFREVANAMEDSVRVHWGLPLPDADGKVHR